MYRRFCYNLPPTTRIKDMVIQFDFVKVVIINITYLITSSRTDSTSQEFTGFIDISNLFFAASKSFFARSLLAQHAGKTVNVFILKSAPNKFVSRFTTHTTSDLTT